MNRIRRISSMRALVFFVSFFQLFSRNVFAQLDSLVYQGLNVQPCVRYLNATSEIGCQADITNGIVYEVKTSDDLQAFINTAPTQKYAVVMPQTMLTRTVIDQLKRSGKLAGILVAEYDSLALTEFAGSSPDDSCPNCKTGLYKSNAQVSGYAWNPSGSGILWSNFDFPIFGLYARNENNEPSLSYIRQAVQRNKAKNYQGPGLYAIEFDAFMWAAFNAEVCLRTSHDSNRQQRCDAIGGHSVWGSSTFNMTSSNDFVVLSAQLDSHSFFQGATVGAQTSVSGLVAVLAAVEALSRSEVPIQTLPRSLLVTLFDAEVWSHAGSQYFVRDLSEFTCESSAGNDACKPSSGSADCSSPCRFDTDFSRIDLAKAAAMVEIGQIGAMGVANPSSAKAYLHVDTVNTANDELADIFVNTASAFTEKAFTNAQSIASRKLPPSSTQAFLDKKASLPHIVIEDFKETYTYDYYNNDLDDGSRWDSDNTDFICNVANMVARSMYRVLANDANIAVPGGIAGNCTLVETLMTCLTRNNSCPLMNETISHPWNAAIIESGTRHTSHFPGPYTRFPRIYSEFGKRWLQYYLSPLRNSAITTKYVYNIKDNVWVNNNDISCTNTTDCGEFVMKQTTVSGGTRNVALECVKRKCVAALSKYHDALPIGFTKQDPSQAITVTDWTKPIWVESRWRSISCRLYVVGVDWAQWLELGVGLGVTVVALAVTYGASFWVEKKLKTV